MTDSIRFLAPESHRIPSECPVCGAYSLAPDANVSALLAVADVLVVKALEKLGNYIVRAERARFNAITALDKPHALAHTIWRPTDPMVDKALRGAWDVVPALLERHGGCCDYDSSTVIEALDQYVHDIAILGQPHDIDELAYRLDARAGVPVYRVAVSQLRAATNGA